MTVKIDGTNTVANPAFTGADTDTGLQCGTDELKLVTGGTARATVDSSGNVGIGNTNPSDYASGAENLVVGDTSSANGITILSGTSNSGGINFADGTSGADRGRIDYDHGDDRMRFYTGAAQKAVIDSSGRMGIGSTSPSSYYAQQLVVDTGSSSQSGITIVSGTSAQGMFAFADGTSGADRYRGFLDYNHSNDSLAFGTDGTERLRLRSDGRMLVQGVYDETTGGAENVNVQSDGLMQRSVSSIKYKKDVETLEDSYSDALLALRAVWYKSKCASDNPDWGYWGFIAEELAEIDPRLVIWKTEEVSIDEDGNQVKTACDPEPEGVQYSRFVPHLLSLIKRQKTKIETLETQHADLLARVTALEATE